MRNATPATMVTAAAAVRMRITVPLPSSVRPPGATGFGNDVTDAAARPRRSKGPTRRAYRPDLDGTLAPGGWSRRRRHSVPDPTCRSSTTAAPVDATRTSAPDGVNHDLPAMPAFAWNCALAASA